MIVGIALAGLGSVLSWILNKALLVYNFLICQMRGVELNDLLSFKQPSSSFFFQKSNFTYLPFSIL